MFLFAGQHADQPIRRNGQRAPLVWSWSNQVGGDVDEGTPFLRVGDAWLELERMPAGARPPPGE
jgi:hypothetical protein